MIPAVNEQFMQDFEEVTLPSKDYALDKSNNRLNGSAEDIEAVKQAIYFMLNTERYNHAIYSWDYGVELADLIGQPYSYVVPELERRVNDCLIQDDRIEGISDFTAEKGKNSVHATFTVHTIFGEIESEVTANV